MASQNFHSTILSNSNPLLLNHVNLLFALFSPPKVFLLFQLDVSSHVLPSVLLSHHLSLNLSVIDASKTASNLTANSPPASHQLVHSHSTAVLSTVFLSHPQSAQSAQRLFATLHFDANSSFQTTSIVLVNTLFSTLTSNMLNTVVQTIIFKAHIALISIVSTLSQHTQAIVSLTVFHKKAFLTTAKLFIPKFLFASEHLQCSFYHTECTNKRFYTNIPIFTFIESDNPMILPT